MASETLKLDENHKPVIGLVTDNAAQEIRMGRIDDATKGLKVMIVGGSSGGVPGGLNTQLQYNNAGAFGGISGATTDGIVVSLTSPLLGGATLTTSTIGNTNAVTLKDTLFTLQDDGDATKQAQFQLSSIATGQTRTFTLPDVSSTVAVLNAAQTFLGTTTFSGATLSFGTSTGASNVGIGTGATLSATTKTVSIGTAGVSGSTTNVNIGSSVGGALGTTTISSVSLVVSGTIVTPTITKPAMSATNPTALNYLPSAGGTATLDLSLSNQHRVQFPAGNVTLALSSDTNAQNFSINLTQDSVGSRTVTWFPGILWAGGSAPNLTTTALKTDIFTFIRTGSAAYIGMVAGMNV